MDDQARLRSKRFSERLELLTAEVDRLALSSTERSGKVDSKLSFLAVAAGIVIAGHTSIAWNLFWVASVPSMGLALASLVIAAIGLRPQKKFDLTADGLVALWLDSEETTTAIERSILKEKARLAALHEASLRSRGRLAMAGFWCLVLSAIALAVEYVVESAV